MIVWKVVNIRKGYISCLAQGRACLTYRVGKRTRPKFGGILVFLRLKDARSFMMQEEVFVKQF